MAPVIEIKELRKKYKDNLAVDNISLSIQKGEVFGFLGPNGAGKTTTINILLGLLKPDSGKCRIFGQDIRSIGKDIYKKMGVVFEEKNLYVRLSGIQNLKFFADMYGVGLDRIDYLLDRFELTEAAGRPVKNYSKGMRQRLLICRALLNDPELLILDEPTGGLDPLSLRIIHNSIMELKEQGKTVMLSTHYMEEAERICDRLAFINRGRIIKIDTPQNLKRKFGEAILEVRISVLPGDRKLEVIKGILTDKDIIDSAETYSSILLSLDSSDTGKKLDKIKEMVDVIAIHSREASLHDVFINLTENRETQL